MTVASPERGSVEVVQFLLFRYAVGQRARDLGPECGQLVEQLDKVRVLDAEELNWSCRPHGCVPRLLRDERHLAHDLTWPRVCDLPACASSPHLQLPADDDEDVMARLAFTHQQRPWLEFDLLGYPGDFLEVALGELSKQRDAPDELDLGVLLESHTSNVSDQSHTWATAVVVSGNGSSDMSGSRWVTFSAMTNVRVESVGSLGLVERVAALHRVELFAAIPGRVLAAVAEIATEERLSPGETLIEEGAVEAHLYAIVEGRIRVHRGDRTLVELGPGATVGELAAPRTCAAFGDSYGA